jgi:hypothetical protein
MKKSIRTIFGTLCVAGLMTLPVAALPIISVDLDPSVMGIQSSRTVDLGATFTAQIVIFDDGLTPPTLFDTLLLETYYNDAGAILGAGPTGPTWLPSALISPFALDFFTGLFPSFASGAAGVGPSILFPPFGAGSGALSLLDLIGTTLVPSTPIPLLTLDFTALSLGTSTILAAGQFGLPAMAAGGIPLPDSLMSATVTVALAEVPAPSILAIFLLGLAGIGFSWKRKSFKF